MPPDVPFSDQSTGTVDWRWVPRWFAWKPRAGLITGNQEALEQAREAGFQVSGPYVSAEDWACTDPLALHAALRTVPRRQHAQVTAAIEVYQEARARRFMHAASQDGG